MEVSNDAQISIDQGVFLKKDDPKVIALLQQAELLSSLAIRVNIENTYQSLENIWKILQDFLNQPKENDMVRCNSPDMYFQFEVFNDLIEDLRSSKEEITPSLRQPNLHEESPGSSKFSTGSTILYQTAVEKTVHAQAEISLVHQDIEVEIPSSQSIQQNGDSESKNIHISPTANQGVLSAPLPTEFGSPLHVIPVFRSLAGIPSPKFSESERNFLMKTLGAESPSLYLTADPSQPAPCKRALLPSL